MIILVAEDEALIALMLQLALTIAGYRVLGPAADVAEALRVDAEEWRDELPLIEEWFEFVGEKLPTSVKDEFEALKQRLG